MADSRICPECKKEVPLEASYYYCPYCFCFFDREKRNDQTAGGLQGRFREQINFWLSIKWEYFFSGLVGSGMFLALGYFLEILELDELAQSFFPWLMSGVWAGIIGTSIDRQSDAYLSTLKIIGIVIFSAFIGVFSFLCMIVSNDS